jgi:hypothetical protein
MRINIYSEELTDRVEQVEKTVDGTVFYGVRFYLKSPPDLHSTPEDDDTSAVTFWAPDRNALILLMDLGRGAADL